MLEASLTTALITILLMVAFRPVALAIGLVDMPGGRKQHVGAIPMTGGSAMYVAIAIGLTLFLRTGSGFVMMPIAGGLLVLIGLIDDRFQLSVVARLMAQLTAVLVMMYGAGLRITDIGDPLWIGRIGLGPFSHLVTALIVLSVINAYNFVDGADGLAGSLALVALVGIALVAGIGSAEQAVALIAAAAVFAFLMFNFPVAGNRPLRAFMGDSGSTLLGLVIAWLAIGICQGSERAVSPVFVLWFAALPVFDFFTCFVRRLFRKTSPFTPGRDHFHHVLSDSGMSERQTLVTMLTLQVCYTAIGVGAAFASMNESLLFTLWAIMGLSQLKTVRAITRLLASNEFELTNLS